MELNSKEIDLPYVTIRYETPIVYLTFKNGAELGFPETRELIRCAEKLSNRTPYLIFSDSRTNMKVTREGRRVASDSKEAPLHFGSAILVNSDMLKLGINFFNDFRKPLFPYRAFTDKQEAIDWLLKLDLSNPQPNP